MGNMFGSSSSPAQGNSHFVATGQTVYRNSNGDTVHDSFQNINGEFTRETATSNSPVPTGFLQPQPPGMSWMTPVAGTAMVLLVVALFIYSRRSRRYAKRTTVIKEDAETGISAIPLYSLNSKARPQHASDAMWNIDLLDD